MEDRKVLTMIISFFVSLLLIQIIWYGSTANNTSLKSSNEIMEYDESIPIEVQWNYTYGGLSEDCYYSSSIIQTNDGGFLIAGHTQSYGLGFEDAWLVKTDSSGIIQWNQTYGGVNFDRAYSVIQTDDGGFLLAGWTLSYGAGVLDVFLVKTFNNGTMQWNRTYGGAGLEGAFSLIQASDGGILVAGFTGSYGAGSEDAWLFKTFSNGTIQWNQTYGGIYDERIYSIIEVDDGILLAGMDGGQGVGKEDVWLIKTDSIGTMLWNQTYGGLYFDGAYSLSQTADGELLLAGSTRSFGIGTHGFFVKAYSNGTMQWNQNYGVDNNIFSVIHTNDEGFLAVGTSGSDIWIIKMFSNGTMHWNQTLSYGGTNEGYTVIETANGEFVIAGSASTKTNDFDLWLIKIIESTGEQSSSRSSLSYTTHSVSETSTKQSTESSGTSSQVTSSGEVKSTTDEGKKSSEPVTINLEFLSLMAGVMTVINFRRRRRDKA